MLTGDPRTGGVPVASVVPAIVEAAPVKDEPSTVTLAAVDVAKTAPANPLAHLPAPFSEIARIEGNRAFTSSGTFVAELPQAVADDLVLSLSGWFDHV